MIFSLGVELLGPACGNTDQQNHIDHSGEEVELACQLLPRGNQAFIV